MSTAITSVQENNVLWDFDTESLVCCLTCILIVVESDNTVDNHSYRRSGDGNRSKLQFKRPQRAGFRRRRPVKYNTQVASTNPLIAAERDRANRVPSSTNEERTPPEESNAHATPSPPVQPSAAYVQLPKNPSVQSLAYLPLGLPYAQHAPFRHYYRKYANRSNITHWTSDVLWATPWLMNHSPRGNIGPS